MGGLKALAETANHKEYLQVPIRVVLRHLCSMAAIQIKGTAACGLYSVLPRRVYLVIHETVPGKSRERSPRDLPGTVS